MDYIRALSLTEQYRERFPSLTQECLLQEMLGRGPRWFVEWWLKAPATTRHVFLRDSGLVA